MKRTRKYWMYAVLALSPGLSYAQVEGTETLIHGEVDHSLQIEPETKFSSIGGGFANFTGMSIGLGMNDRFEIGVGGYGLTNRLNELTMGYGGLVLGYNHRPNRLLHFSFGGLLGAGNATFFNGRDYVLFVAEPEAKMTLNVSRMVRLGFGIGYRFVGNAGDASGDLSGFSGTFSVGFAFFKD